MKRTEQDRSTATQLPVQDRSMQPPIQERPSQSISQQRLTQERATQEQPVQERLTRERATYSAPASSDLEEAVRRRAYEIYEQRGMVEGSEIEDWLQAEAELMDNRGRQKAA